MQAETIKVKHLNETFFRNNSPVYNKGFTAEELCKKHIKLSKNPDVKKLQIRESQVRICQFGRDRRLKNIPFISYQILGDKKMHKIYLITDDEEKLKSFNDSQVRRLNAHKATVKVTQKMIGVMDQLKLFK